MGQCYTIAHDVLHIQDPSEATEPIQLKCILAHVELKYILPYLVWFADWQHL